MKFQVKRIRYFLCCKVLFSLICLHSFCLSFSQPANDSCTNASVVIIPNAGFALGTFSSATYDISSATIQTGETFAPAILVAGLNKKSTWYKFTIPTTRAVRVTLAQPGTAITAGDAGFAVYKTNNCLPVNSDISTKLTPIGTFGNTFHPCVGAGDYLIQVTGNNNANGPLYLQLQLSDSTNSVYDHPPQAYNFGALSQGIKSVDYSVDCQSIEDAAEVCPALYNSSAYNKTTWHVFKTPAYFDYLAILLASPTGSFSNGIDNTIGYNLYRGDARTTAISTMTPVTSCDSFFTYGFYPAVRLYRCSDLQPDSTYSIQLFFRDDFYENIRLAISLSGIAPTLAPEPILSAVPPSNSLGILPSSPSGETTTGTDYFGCNSRHEIHPCPPSLPASGINYYNPYYNFTYNYNLSTFYTFTLSSTSNIDISTGTNCWSTYVRLYKQGLSNSCNSLDTSNIVSQFQSNNYNIKCLDPGTYTLQISGSDTALPYYSWVYYASLYNTTSPLCILGNLGQSLNVNITVRTIHTINQFSLSSAGAFDTINAISGIMQPLVNGNAYYTKIDTFGCSNTVLPWDTACTPTNKKAMYRQFQVADSGITTLYYLPYYWFYYYNFSSKLYKGDANTLAISQNAHSYPQRISGLDPYTLCLQNNTAYNPAKACIVPGTYSYITFGDEVNIGQFNQSIAEFHIINTIHNSPDSAEDLGDILNIIPPNGSMASSTDYFSCKDNVIPINGYVPCSITGQPATKAIYRQFYLNSSGTISISGPNSMTLFSGKATDGIATLTVMPNPWQCFTNASSLNNCLPAGWYTIISYGGGPTYQNPLQNYEANYYLGKSDQITISACPGPKHNRPYKAAIDTTTNQPFLIQWGPRIGSTPAYPMTDTTYTLYQEYYNCTVDTPFSLHPIVSCDPSLTKVTYYVFKTTQESYVQITVNEQWGAVYSGDVRFDSAAFATATPIQPCVQGYGNIQLCRLQPGTYTLVVFATGNNSSCASVTPTIYIDKTGYSRFDHANNAYDFGVIPPDSLYHDGKVGDVNPLDPGRAPSNDFFYCTTGARPDDPADAVCGQEYNSNIYTGGINNYLYPSPNTNGGIYYIPRRNLWYTFVLNQGGNVKVKVSNKTIDKQYQYRFVIYKSDVDGTLPFSTVVNTGQVDSTSNQGLSFITQNYAYYYCWNASNEVSFYRDPCNPAPERYYILVENTYSMAPNSQAEISILLDSVNSVQPLFDHYYQASNIGSSLGPGTYMGQTDNFSCATLDPTDPLNGYDPVMCRKTLWYKFTTTITGHVRYRLNINNGNYYDNYNVQLSRQIIPGDSTNTGLQFYQYNQYYDYSTGTYWAQNCIYPGTYYLLLPGCSRINEYVTPEIQIIEEAGDFCSNPVLASLNGAGTSVSSIIIDCHTIGSDYGEFNPTLTCPNGATTSNYKTSWFKIDITGADTLDVTTWLTENTNAQPSEIKYRLMNGDCSAMQERSCVQDAQTQDTYKCLPPGSYWVQVFTPVTKNGQPVTGTIDLHLSAVHHADTCAPINACFANANFIPQFDCNAGDFVTFVNYSTYGSSILYTWDFGYNCQTSSAVSPQFSYPALPNSQTYNISLTVQNTSCGGQGIVNGTITIPPRPAVNLGPDISLCNGASVLLDATSYPGATYLWQDGSTNPTYTVTTPGLYIYYVAVTYNGCTKKDTINVNINPMTPIDQDKYLCSTDSIQLNSSRGYGETYSWNNGATGSSINVNAPGIYWNDVSLNGCTVRDSFTVTNATYPLGNDRQFCFNGQPFVLNATTSGAVSYTWQNGTNGSLLNAATAGIYWVDISFGSCVLRDSIVLADLQPYITFTGVHTCAGNGYTLPSGTVIYTSGVYHDTLRSAGGCDSVITFLNITFEPVTDTTFNASICAGQTYTLPWGIVVTAAGIYSDTLRSDFGCDSVRRTVNLTVNAISSSTTNTTVCSNQLPYTWNGTNYSAGGSFTFTTINAAGCDSAATLILTINNTSTSVTNVTRCSNQLPYTWNGINYNAAGSYVYHTLNAVSCDSAATLNLTINNTSTSVTNVTRCSNQLPYTWNGTNYNAAGSYVYHTLNAVSCDSAATLNLTINNTSTSVTNITRCSNQLPYTWNGTNYNAGGSFTFTTVNTGGCDSVATLNLTINNTSTSVTNVTRCSNQLPYTWNGTNYNAAGTFVYHTLNAAGCDSAAMLNLTVNAVSSSTTDVARCSNQLPFIWNGTNYNAAGSFTFTAVNAAGCDSVATLNLIINNTSTSFTNVTRCSNQLPFTWNGTNYNAAGSYVYHTLNAAGCDSAATLNLIINNTSTSVTNITRCSNQLPYTWNGTNYNAAGTYVYHTLNAIGCDSAATLNLIVNAVSISTTNISRCSNQLPYTWNGTNYNAAGTYVYHTLNTVGCDSAATLNLTINNTSTSVTNVTRCSNQLPYIWNGINYNAGGSFTFTTVNAAGCDSVATLNLIINNTSTSVTNITRCSNQLPYTWNGTNYNAAGSYVYHTLNAVGCDSAATLNLAVNAVSISTTNVTRCSNQLPYTWNGTNYNAAGSYIYHTLNAVGCDSAATLNLTINNTSTSATNVTRCSNQLPYTWNGTNYSAGGSFTFTTINAASCDSVATLNLTINNTSTSVTNVTRCSNQLPFTWNGTNYNAAGTYVYHTPNAAGCDSAATLNLTINNTSTSVTNVTRCSTQLPYTWNGTNYNAGGSFTFTTINAAGCDSVATLNLTINNTSTSVTNVTRCSNQLPYTWNGTNYNVGGSFTFTTINAAGCDSAATLNLTINNTSTSVTNVTRCFNQLPYTWNGTNYNAAGSYVYHTLNAVGCDSAATLNLTVNAVSSSTTNIIRCSNQLPYTWNGTNYNAAGSYVYHTLNAVGCDSAATLNLTINNTSTSVTNVTRCSNQLPYTWNGTNYNTGGSFTFTTINAAGCDSVATLNLIINNTSTSVTNVTRCSNQLPYTWNGTNYNAAGSYVYHTLNAVSCDSAATLNLTVNAVSSSTTNITRCSNQLPYTWNGTNYNAAGSYVYHTLNAVGCDSAATLNLTINNTSTSVTNVTRCSNQLPYTWNGTNYNSGGSFTFTTVNAAGCDSVSTLNLTVNATSSSTTNTTICSNQLPYNWNGTNYNVAGIYLYHTLNSVGCDSAVTLSLTVQSPTSVTTNPNICAGQSYTLPWGTVVNTGGVYRDTLHYITGCDSIRRTVNLTVQSSTLQTTNPVICAGQTYTLPWGTIVNTSGVYRDTLHYTTGCDSIRRSVNLTVQSPTSVSTNPVICQGGSYTLPWGVVVNTEGTYRDTLHYTTGCDSVRRTVNLQVIAAVVSTTNAIICSDETYTLPWGAVINIAGVYKDTVRTSVGCDSLIRTVNLAVNSAPSVSVSRSNDINCMLGIANLQASGGVNYTWTPASSLNNAAIYNPVASPSATTWYKVVVTSDKGCTTEDSIQVKVIPGNTDNGYLMPNAFTPNGDGKNDCFGVQTWGVVTDFEFSIFSRWGERVFYTNDPKQCWDGRYKGTEQSANVFVYQIKAKGLCGDIYRKGTFVLIR